MVKLIRLSVAMIGAWVLLAGISGRVSLAQVQIVEPTEAFRQTVQAAFNATLTAQAPTPTVTSTPSGNARQEGTPFQMWLIHDKDSLTALVYGSGSVSLEGFGVKVNNRGLDISGLRSLRDLSFTQIALPLCIHLETTGTPRDVPQSCLDVQNRYLREINLADTIWYDGVTDTVFALEVNRAGVSMGTCVDVGLPCSITFTPLIPSNPTPTPSPTLPPNGEVRSGTYTVNGLYTTDIYVLKGEIITVRAMGSITVGQFVGTVDPNGTEYTRNTLLQLPVDPNYDIVSAYAHGALLCRIKGE
ncbi:MAG: hypothetical protein ACOYLB_16550 [Phototrophicaceae bacterium]